MNSSGRGTATKPSLGRLVITPLLLIAAGFLVFGLAGAAIGGMVGIGYVFLASAH